MKKQFTYFFSTLLLLSITWQCSAKSFIFINFKIHQTELAKTQCINKDKPKSCCAAKCVLDKELKKEDKRQSDFPSSLKDKFEKTEITSDYLDYTCFQNSVLQKIKFNYSLKESSEKPSTIFHPPC